MKRGFSFVELSLVLIVIATILAGVISGTKLLKQAELRSTVTKLTEFEGAYNTFITHYKGIPGDHGGAEAFFSSCADTPANCNGDGNGNINASATVSDEVTKSFVHLSLAKLIGERVTTPISDMHDGSNLNYAFDSDHGTAKYFFGGRDTALEVVTPYNALFTDYVAIYLGKFNSTSLRYNNGALTGLDAYQIDKKIDDGETSGSNTIGATSGSFRASSGVDALACATGNNYNITTTLEGCVVGYAVEQ